MLCDGHWLFRFVYRQAPDWAALALELSIAGNRQVVVVKVDYSTIGISGIDCDNCRHYVAHFIEGLKGDIGYCATKWQKNPITLGKRISLYPYIIYKCY